MYPCTTPPSELQLYLRFVSRLVFNAAALLHCMLSVLPLLYQAASSPPNHHHEHHCHDRACHLLCAFHTRAVVYVLIVCKQLFSLKFLPQSMADVVHSQSVRLCVCGCVRKQKGEWKRCEEKLSHLSVGMSRLSSFVNETNKRTSQKSIVRDFIFFYFFFLFLCLLCNAMNAFAELRFYFIHLTDFAFSVMWCEWKEIAIEPHLRIVL